MTADHHSRGSGHQAGPEAEPRPADGQEHGAPEAHPAPGTPPAPAFHGWQPIPSSPEYDAEGTAFVQLPPELADPSAPLPQGWDPLAAPGTGYTPPPGAHWHPQQPADGEHGQGGQPYASPYDLPQGQHGGQHGDPYADQHGGAPLAPGAGGGPTGTGQWSLPGGEDAAPGAEAQATGQWSIPFAPDDGPDEVGEFRLGEHGPTGYGAGQGARRGDTLGHGQPYADQGAPAPHEDTLGDPQAQPLDPQTTPEWPVPSALGGTGQWTLPTVGDEGLDETGEYTMSAYRYGLPPYPDAPRADAGRPAEQGAQPTDPELPDHGPYADGPDFPAGPGAAEYGHGVDADPYATPGYPTTDGPEPPHAGLPQTDASGAAVRPPPGFAPAAQPPAVADEPAPRSRARRRATRKATAPAGAPQATAPAEAATV
ncbi:hypothetical protein AAHZ94_28250, partial [Streptomyces sp. HSW2009]